MFKAYMPGTAGWDLFDAYETEEAAFSSAPWNAQIEQVIDGGSMILREGFDPNAPTE